MRKLEASFGILAAALVILTPPAFAGDFAAPGLANRSILLAGGMSGGAGGMNGGGGAGGMGGGGSAGAGAGGMSGGAGGMSGGAGGMSGGGGMTSGGRFGGAMMNFGRPSQQSWETNPSADSYTYRCVTAAASCSFVAPAWMRANTLRSGADCACDSGQTKGRVE